MNSRIRRSAGSQPPTQTTKGDYKLPLFVLLLALAPFASAAPRTSTNYSIPAEAADSGGRRAISASYTNDGSAAPIVGVSTVAGPAQTAKHGYIAQLYEVTGFVVNAGSSQVNETATLQLAAWQLLDDMSFLAVPATSVAWSVVSGPVSGINAAGLATAGTVPQNNAATVQGALGGFTGSLNLTVLDSIADNFGTYAGDGLGDDWQVQYFGQPPNALAGPSIDADGDGQTNLFEFTAGLTPTDANSVFRLRLESVPGQPAQKRVIFNPLVLPAGRTYTVKFRTDLTTGTWSTLTGTTQSDAGNERTVTDLNATGATKFYQVEINKP